MRKIRIFTYISLFVLFFAPFWSSLAATFSGGLPAYSLDTRDSVISVRVDSVRKDTSSLASDTLPKKKNALDAIVDYIAQDSIVLTSNNWGYLYGESEVNYTELTLKAENISMNMDSSIAKATYGIDSTGAEFGYPIFTDHGTDYEAKTMNYNLKTKKMFVNEIITEQGEGYVRAGIAKKTEDDAFFMSHGRYTTCDEIDCPHFYFALTKGKVRPKKNVVTGPAYLVIEGLPLPFIGLPFGFFPFTDKYSSGVIMPSFNDEMERGFNLRDGGYYFAINDQMDLAVTGEIYTKGSWGLNAHSNYRKRYRHSGSFDIGYLVTKYGDKGLPDYSVSKDTRIAWTHSQDAKANMFRTLSASVNFSTSSYDRNQLNSIYNPSTYTQNTKSSSVNLTQRFPNSPWSVSASMNIDQRSKDSTIAMTLPNMSITMSRINPFKRKDAVGSEHWYEKIQLSYRGELRNSITTKEDKLLNSNFQKDWKKAMRHSIPISATYSLFNHLNITPSVNYNERWYTEKVTQKWDGTRLADVDTTYSFSRVYDFNAQVSLQTKMYGFFKPLFDKKSTIRHVFTPSVSFSYAPDFSDPRFGYYQTETYYDANGDLQKQTYSLFKNGIFGAPSAGKQGMINFQFDNNIEMKRQMTDTVKKISLVDNLGVGFSYNMMADSMKWSDISTNMRFKLSKNLTVNLNATFDPYIYDYARDKDGKEMWDSNGKRTGGLTRINTMRLSSKGVPGRLMRTGYSISPSINQDTFAKWFGKDEKGAKAEPQYDEDGDLIEEEDLPQEKKGSRFAQKKDAGEYDEDGYMKHPLKWTLSASYSFSYAYDYSNPDYDTKEFKYKLVHNLGFNGSIQPTKNWNFNFSSGYDFDRKELTYLNCSLSRDLHCFTLTASFIPVGPYKSYFVSLRANASMLQDLKYDKRGRSSSYDPAWE